ncbi:MAG: acyl-CoA dehydrogenase family protein [Bacteroidota bacterium]
MQSPYFTEEHDLFRNTARQFMQTEVIPFANEWEKEKKIPRTIWKKMGELGFLGINFPEKYGGADADFFYTVAFLEEVGHCALAGFTAAVLVQQYMATAHLFKVGSEALKEKYLVPSIAGKLVGALAVTEPDAGSDVAAIRTRAVREGDEYVITGSKTFITNGVYGDFITVAVKTGPEAGVEGISLIIVDSDTPGFSAKKLEKMGLHCSDTGELSFDDVRVPASNLIGQENMGFYYIMESFQLERLVAAITSVGTCDICIEETLKYIAEREVFNKPLAKFQVIRHALADAATELEAARQLTYYTSWLYEQGEQAVREYSMVKLLTTELSKKIADTCLQFFGGYGYMDEYPISRIFRDARVSTIVGGASEIMREIIAKVMIDQVKYESAYDRTRAETSETAAEQPEKDGSKTSRSPETVAELFQTLPDRFRPEKAGDWETVVHFDITGDAGEQYTVTIKDGVCSVELGLHGEAKCVVKTKDKTYLNIELGKTNPQTAFMMGKIRVSNLAEMMQFGKVFRRIS